ncbi:rCG23354 [Rattus norvegicus]|uniref:RCG23354 n=1 Tax=Rattus norvegicus TaxID=10116 RepID=A6KGT2_RAT|nr:rCG23354 [Rattus norvegicus]
MTYPALSTTGRWLCLVIPNMFCTSENKSYQTSAKSVVDQFH